MELLITGIENGVIKFVEGEEQEVGVEYLKGKISQIDAEVNDIKNSNSLALEDLAKSKTSAFEAEANKLAEAKNRLDLEYKEAIEAIESKFEEQSAILNQKKLEGESKINALLNERNKLSAILDGVSKIDLPKEEPVVSNEPEVNLEEVAIENLVDPSLNIEEPKEEVVVEEKIVEEPKVEEPVVINIPQPQPASTPVPGVVREEPKIKF